MGINKENQWVKGTISGSLITKIGIPAKQRIK